MFRRRLITKAAVVIAATMVAAACGGGGFEKGGGGGSKEPIKVGVVTGLTGPYVGLGKAQRNGAKLAINSLDGKAGSHPISVIVRDGQTDPDAALREAKSLVQSDHVNFLTGCVSAAVTLALNQVAKQAGIPYIGTCQTSQLTRPPYFDPKVTYHIAPLTSQPIGGYMNWLCSNLGKKVYLLLPDYAWGHEQYAAYLSDAPKAGCKIVGKSWAPLGTTDFTPYIPKIRNAKPDVLIVGAAGRDQVNSVKQAHQFGLAKHMKIFMNLAELPFDQEMGFNVVNNTYAATTFYWVANQPDLQKFVKTYRKQYGAPPSGYAAYVYNAVHLIAEAAAANKYSPADFRKFMEGHEFSYGLGPQRIRACDHQSSQTTYIVEGLSKKEAAKAGSSAKYRYRKIVETIPSSQEHAPTCAQAAKRFHPPGPSK
ncbi:MAG: ABC transporter substrate-binding protein [Nocardioidaceae bacterium]